MELSLKPHASFNFAYSAIRSATRNLAWHLTTSRSSKKLAWATSTRLLNSCNTCYYDTKVVNKKILALKEKVNKA
ncbi:hypothetical protein F8388_010595 [Cannabis sativa]|uniref:Uncharacterized protein n=1 Tax=Cannabis sativa TaxID=3483 RepID=A0A7J6GQ33_CANSA|nr:hypothetical protein F8388_010595 [Cannabis sativa]